MTNDDVDIRVVGRLGHITLDRPERLNALTPGILTRISDALASWHELDDVETVLLDGAGDRGFCAGGDVRMITESTPEDARAFWELEYATVLQIATFPKPVVAVMDGVTMGGGVGLAGHARHRIVTERSRVAMPEVRIGLAPDVGGALLLARAPGLLGLHLGLTAATMTGADAVAAGFADAFVRSDDLVELVDALIVAGPDASEIVARVAQTPPASELLAARPWIDAAYDAGTIDEILASLRARPEAGAAEAADAMGSMSPTSLAVTLRTVELAALDDDLERVLHRDLGVSTALFARPDFAEGVRAQVVDKDRAPRWAPAQVDPTEVEAIVSAR
ncbi:3-hydroxyisobutyryl-CoA hydrolase [Labedella endophytica]|uniref:3-hydroxyisobutyryl-CoA hydrolase n=1 Tax=Labedella endophytica TaxID=1523160 RepID=A0A433JWI1_9MICO|nr:3-hydroxyisobutyryl-CoA hydrolase [Labedella endophytica]RUR03451.1 enoyl-CoA hydratase/isomerase family protein [Labedella endophytica]